MSAAMETLPIETGSDYARHDELVPILLWRAREPVCQTLVLIVPALGTPARVYRRLAETLQAAGADAAVLELRGVGQSPVRARRGVDWAYNDLVDGEIQHAIRTLKRQFPTRRMIGLGHSLGGHAILLHQARHPDQALDQVVLVGSGAPYWRSYRWPMSWVTRGFGTVVAASSRVLGYFPGSRLGFGGNQGQTLMRQWSRFLASGSLAVAHWRDDDWRRRLRQLPVPLRAIHVPGDGYAPKASIGHLLTEVGSRSPVETADVEGAPGHFGWLKMPEGIVRQVLAST